MSPRDLFVFGAGGVAMLALVVELAGDVKRWQARRTLQKRVREWLR